LALGFAAVASNALVTPAGRSSIGRGVPPRLLPARLLGIRWWRAGLRRPPGPRFDAAGDRNEVAAAVLAALTMTS
jgi:hypothetical protein